MNARTLGAIACAGLAFAGCTRGGSDAGQCTTATLASGAGYRAVAAGPTPEVAFASVPGGTEEALHLVRVGQDPVELSARALVDSVQVAANPPRALFIADAGTSSFGTLQLAEIASATTSAVPGGSAVPANGFVFGPSGSQALFVSGWDDEKGTGRLNWWGGGSSSETIAENASPQGWLLTEDRSQAVAAVDLADGMGRLMVVNLADGTHRELASGVKAIGPTGVRLFSMSADGQVAWIDAAGALHLGSLAGGDPVLVDGGTDNAGPGFSSDGTKLGWYALSRRSVFLKGAGAEPEAVASLTWAALPVSAPPPVRFLENGRVLYLNGWTRRGSRTPEQVIGEPWVATAGGEPARLGGTDGQDVSWTSITLLSDGRIAALAKLRDLTGQGSLDDGALGELHVTGADLAFGEAVARGITASDAWVLGEGAALAYVANVARGAKPEGEAFLWRSPGGSSRLAAKVVPRTLRTSGDRALFLADAQDAAGQRVGTLYSVRDGAARILDRNVFTSRGAVLTPEGCALYVVGSGDRAGVRTQPVR